MTRLIPLLLLCCACASRSLPTPQPACICDEPGCAPCETARELPPEAKPDPVEEGPPPPPSVTAQQVAESSYEVEWPPLRPDHTATKCASLPKPKPITDLIGSTYHSAWVNPPRGLRVRSAASVGRHSVLVASRGASTVLVVSHVRNTDMISYQVTAALEIGELCEGLEIELLTCVVNGVHDDSVFALMDGAYTCGGHGESSPARAWRVTRSGKLTQISPNAVTCGSVSCEVDPPLPPPQN